MTAQGKPVAILRGQRMRRSLLWSLVILTALAGFAVRPSPATGQASLDGSYAVAGTNADGSTYSGTAKIVKYGDVYLFEWTVGDETYGGIGIVEGNRLSCGWAVSKGERRLGVQVYNIESDRLVGRWASLTADGDKQVGQETLTRSP